MSEPLDALTQKGNTFPWTKVEQNAFESLNRSLLSVFLTGVSAFHRCIRHSCWMRSVSGECGKHGKCHCLWHLRFDKDKDVGLQGYSKVFFFGVGIHTLTIDKRRHSAIGVCNPRAKPRFLPPVLRTGVNLAGRTLFISLSLQK